MRTFAARPRWTSLALPLLLLTVLAALAACSSAGSTARTAPTATATVMPTATSTPAPTPVVEHRTVQIPADGGTTLSGTLYGRGRTAVLFANQTDTRQGDWESLATEFAARGYLALTFDYAASAYDTDTAAAARYLRAQGVERLVLIGASIGGLAVVSAAPGAKPLALVSISAPIQWPGIGDMSTILPTLTMPKLFVDARYDSEAQDIQRAYDVSAQPKELHFYEGTSHGVEILSRSDGPDLTRRILAFVQTNAPA